MKGVIITGDVAGFTTIPAKKREQLMNATRQLLSAWQEQDGYAEIFRGDSFQLLFKQVPEALTRTIQLRCWFRKSLAEKQRVMLDARLALGIGEISYFGNSVLDSDGEAFHLSGREFDVMKESRLRIVTADERLNKQLEAITGLLDVIISSWTAGQAEVIFLLLENKTQQQMAAELGIAQSAVNNRIRLSKWKETEKTLHYLVQLLEEKQ